MAKSPLPKEPKDFEDPEDPFSADGTPPADAVNDDDSPSPATGDIVAAPRAELDPAHQREIAPGFLPGDVCPAFNVAELKAALESNDVTAQSVVARLCYFLDHPNPTFALGAMRILLAHVETVIRLNGITVKVTKELPGGKEAVPDPETSSSDPSESPADNPPDDPHGGRHFVTATRIGLPGDALDRLPGVTLHKANDPSFQ